MREVRPAIGVTRLCLRQAWSQHVHADAVVGVLDAHDIHQHSQAVQSHALGAIPRIRGQ